MVDGLPGPYPDKPQSMAIEHTYIWPAHAVGQIEFIYKVYLINAPIGTVTYGHAAAAMFVH